MTEARIRLKRKLISNLKGGKLFILWTGRRTQFHGDPQNAVSSVDDEGIVNVTEN